MRTFKYAIVFVLFVLLTGCQLIYDGIKTTTSETTQQTSNHTNQVTSQVLTTDSEYQYFKLTELFKKFENSNYLSYQSRNEVISQVSGVQQQNKINSVYKQYLNQYDGSNAFYNKLEYSLPNTSYFEEAYATLGSDGMVFITRNTDVPSWYSYTMSFEDMFESDPGFSEGYLYNLVKGLDGLSSMSIGDSIVFDVPISRVNFSINTLPDFIEMLYVLELIDETLNPDQIERIEDLYFLIECSVTTDKNITSIREIRLDYSAFLDALLSEFDLGTVITSASFTVNVLSSSSFILNFPTDVSPYPINYLPSGLTLVNLDKQTILDSVVDTDHKNIYYTVEGDHYLYKLNYETFEKDQIYFEILPDQLFYRNDKVYVGLSDGHRYYWPDEEQYGGLAIVDAISFEKIKEFDLSFDPYSIVVDKEGFIYISEGSYQHCSLISINPNTGQIIDEMSGIYYMGKILFSDYTNRIYYVELQSTQDELEVFEVNRGDIVRSKYGTNGFNEAKLSMSPDGKTIYSGNGRIFELQSNYSSDGVVVKDIAFTFDHAGFDLVNNMKYLATTSGILKVDSQYQVIGAYEYSGSSKELVYDNHKLINIGVSTIEILDLENTEQNNYAFVTTVSYGSTFNINQYMTNMFGSNVSYEHVSGNINTNTLGQSELVYNVITNEGAITTTIYLNVIDDQAPEISIPTNTSFQIPVNSEFTPPICSATDNYDQEVTCSVLQNEVDPTTIGSYNITYIATDSNGNVSKKTVSFTVILPLVPYTTVTHQISDGIIGDAVYDFTSNSVFYIVSNTKEVVKMNLTTMVKERLSFNFLPETLTVHKGKLYVSIIHKAHSPYWWEEDQTGEIAIIDMNTFHLDASHKINVDPYQLIVTDTHLYVVPGSGQWVNIVAYDLTDFTKFANVCGVREKTFVAYQPKGDYVFGITNGLSPQSLERYQFSGLTCTGSIDDPGHGDYSYGRKIYVSPNGDYVFSEKGQKFYQIETSSKKALDYAGDMKFPISAMYFDTTNKITFFGQLNGFVKFSYTSDYKVTEEVNIGVNVEKIYGDNDSIYVISHVSEQLLVVVAEKK